VNRLSGLLTLVLACGCTKTDHNDSTTTSTDDTAAVHAECVDGTGCLLAEDLPYGLLSVQAASDDDIWVVGSSPEPADGTGPAILHYDNESWEKLDTSAWAGAEMWWTWVQPDEAIFVGNQGLILQMTRPDGTLEQVTGPTEDVTFFGVWGASSDDVWAVGQTDGGDGPRAIWRRQDGTWSAWEDDTLGVGDDAVIYFKVHGTAADDVWMVGTGGRSLHWDGTSLQEVATDAETPTSTTPLLTVDADPDHPVVVGGAGNGLILEYDGTAWRDKSPEFQPGFNGVCSGAGQQWAVGTNGSRSSRNEDGSWSSDMDHGHSPSTFNDWHGCDVTPSGDLWTVGGRIAARPLSKGVIGFQGGKLPAAISE
jgi:hypothetical protein